MANTTNFGWETPDDTDLVKDGALAMRTLGNAIDTSLVDLKGGTTGQVLSKNTNTDMDFTWVTPNDADAIQNTIVDAKGDLISASAADVPARLAVGADGSFLMAASGETTGLRYNPQNALANPFINGGMDIWQRGTSIAGTTTSFSADRWQSYRGVAGSTFSRQTVSDSTNLPNIQYACRVQRDSGNSSTTALFLWQNFETVNSIPFAGKTITLSFYARAGANYSRASSALPFKLVTGTGTDQNSLTSTFTGQVSAIDTSVTLTTTWQRFAATATLNSTITQIGFGFQFTPVGTAGADDWFEVTGVQIDLGTYTASTAPTFRRSGGTLQGELAACQRYYEKSYDVETAPGTITNNGANAGTRATGGWATPQRFLVRKRGVPTITIYSNISGTAAKIRNRDTAADEDVASVNGIGQTGFMNITGSGGTTGVLYQWHYVAESEL